MEDGHGRDALELEEACRNSQVEVFVDRDRRSFLVSLFAVLLLVVSDLVGRVLRQRLDEVGKFGLPRLGQNILSIGWSSFVRDGLKVDRLALGEGRVAEDDGRETRSLALVESILEASSPGVENHEAATGTSRRDEEGQRERRIETRMMLDNVQQASDRQRNPGTVGDLSKRGAEEEAVNKSEEEEERDTKGPGKVLDEGNLEGEERRGAKHDSGDWVDQRVSVWSLIVRGETQDTPAKP